MEVEQVQVLTLEVEGVVLERRVKTQEILLLPMGVMVAMDYLILFRVFQLFTLEVVEVLQLEQVRQVVEVVVVEMGKDTI